MLGEFAVIGGMFMGDPARCLLATFSAPKVDLSHGAHRILFPSRRLHAPNCY